MGQRRRQDLAPNAAGRRAQLAAVVPSEVGKDVALKALLGPNYGVLKTVTCTLQSPHALATLLGGYDTGVVGVAGPVATYNIDLASIGFTATADYAANTVILITITTAADTYWVKVDAADTFTAGAVGAGTISIAGTCAINRGNGTLKIDTDGVGPTDSLAGGYYWTIFAFIVENVSTSRGASPHGAGWASGALPPTAAGFPGMSVPSEAILLPRNGMIEIPHLDASGAPLTTLEQSSIFLQSIPAAAGFAATSCQAAFLISPYQNMKDQATLYYNISNEASRVADHGDASWQAMAWDDALDLIGETLLYTTKRYTGPSLVGATDYMITFRIDMDHLAPLTESTFVYGFAFGVD